MLIGLLFVVRLLKHCQL